MTGGVVAKLPQMNRLYYGDNLDVLREHLGDESVDLIYLDPPFNSDANYNIIFREHKSGEQPQAQITAFEDTWTWSLEAECAPCKSSSFTAAYTGLQITSLAAWECSILIHQKTGRKIGASNKRYLST